VHESGAISFEPQRVESGTFDFNIGTAGSAPLVLQTLLVPLALSGRHSQVMITGGTHMHWSPCFHYLDWHWRSFMRQAGYAFELALLEAGFYPRGGGRIQAVIEAAASIRPLEIMELGRLLSVNGLSAVANLNMPIAERQRYQALQRLSDRGCDADIELQRLNSPGRGTLLLLLAHYEHTQCCFYALGEKGKPAEQVADEAVDQLQAFEASGGAIDPYLADQLILPLALAEGVSRLRTSKISTHLITNAGIIQRFLPVEISTHGKPGEPGVVEIRGCGGVGD